MAALPDDVLTSPLLPNLLQGACGSCWSFATAGTLEIVTNVAGGRPSNGSVSEWFSPQMLLDCIPPDWDPNGVIGPKGCFGGWPATALKYVNVSGIATEASYPYNAVNGATCAFSTAVLQFPVLADVRSVAANDTASIMAAIAQYGAVAAIMHVLPDQVSGGHATCRCCLLSVLPPLPLTRAAPAPSSPAVDLRGRRVFQHCMHAGGAVARRRHRGVGHRRCQWAGLLAGAEQLRAGVGRGRLDAHPAGGGHVRD